LTEAKTLLGSNDTEGYWGVYKVKKTAWETKVAAVSE